MQPAISTPYPKVFSEERFVWRSPPVHYKAKLGQQACEAPKGTLLLSQFRLVLCESGEQPSSSSIAIPLYHIYDEDIRQPIFGCSNVVADLQTEHGLQGSLQVWFTNGGLNDFLHLFIPFMANVNGHRQEIANHYNRMLQGAPSAPPLGGPGGAGGGHVAYVSADNAGEVLVPARR
eukprot:EG_transcript_22271